MQHTLIPFGLLQGRLVRAVEVENGLACGCHCPGCKTPLIAANRGTKNVHHFRHAQAVDCRTGYESSLHKLAVELLVEKKRICLPDFDQVISERTAYGADVKRKVGFPGGPAKADRALSGSDIEGVTPDVIYEIGGHQLLIEVRVSSKVDGAKTQRLRALGLSALEVDLSDMDIRTICDPALFEQALLDSPRNLRWIKSNRGDHMVNLARLQLASDVKEMNETHRLRVKSDVDSSRTTAGNGVMTSYVETGASRVDKAVLRTLIQERAQIIAASIQRSVEEWGGQAMQCENCLIASAPGTTSCSHCGVTGCIKPASFSREYASTALARLKCSPRVDQSFERVPLLRSTP